MVFLNNQYNRVLITDACTEIRWPPGVDSMNIRFCGASHTCGRPNNEDAFAMEMVGNNLWVGTVADGLGGHPAGEVASTLAVNALIASARQQVAEDSQYTLDSMRKILITGFGAASDAVRRDTGRHPDQSGMGTTLVAALINEESDCVIASVGDSRAYLVGAESRQVTKDHTFVQEMVERGLITRDAARVHPERNVVTRTIGVDPVLPDLVEIHMGGDTLLLCTDGFSDLFTEQELGPAFRNPDVTSICDNLIKRAKEANGDNTTVVVARQAQ